MDCKSFRRLIRSRIAGDLDARFLASSRAHEETCPNCRELFELQRSVDAALLAYRDERPSPFVTDLMEWARARQRT